MFDHRSILITGGTGSFGQKCAARLIENYKFKRVIIYSRDELKQFEMSQPAAPPPCNSPTWRWVLGLIRKLGLRRTPLSRRPMRRFIAEQPLISLISIPAPTIFPRPPLRA